MNAPVRTILYVCVHNAGRSQMAEAFTNRIAEMRGLPFRGESAGTIPGDHLNPIAVRVMGEVGIDLSHQHPKPLTAELSSTAECTITMGCGVDADLCPIRILVTEDWGLDDPAGQDIEAVRRIRDEIRTRVEGLLKEMEADA